MGFYWCQTVIGTVRYQGGSGHTLKTAKWMHKTIPFCISDSDSPLFEPSQITPLVMEYNDLEGLVCVYFGLKSMKRVKILIIFHLGCFVDQEEIWH
ncbi:hypothetical protein NC653_034321 [Populus alba x Populus x berolinensis]|uniref:Uncharacterized protein n=1 Tax=Populus alba x Populus x berolinensis TaxID=444605 RepID=A0AAD6LMF1_9ROSI|nr:hypothetical protein NC653_034321 [Populus alba x Populus x berolinensis]